MRTIWYFVGLILFFMGLIIIASGIFNIMYPPQAKTVLGETNPDIWWGSIMTLIGLVYTVSNWRKRVK